MQAADWVSNNSIQFNLFKKTRHNADDAGCWVHKMSEYRIDLLSACLRLMCYTWQTGQSILKTQTQPLKRASPMSYSIWYFLAIISIMVFLIFPIFLIFLIFTIITWKLYFWFCNLYNCKMSRRDYQVEESAANFCWVMCCFSFLIS